MHAPARVGVLQAFSTRPFNVIANLSSVLGLAVLVFAAFEWDAQVIPLAYLCLLSTALLVRYVRQERWARYAEGSQVMEEAMRELKVATDRLLYANEKTDREKFLILLQDSLGNFARAFSLVTGTACRASIKEFYTDEVLTPGPRRGTEPEAKEVLLVATMLRHTAKESQSVADEEADLLDDNSDFVEILTTYRPFHSNDLGKLFLNGKYRNSHWSEDLRSTKRFPYRSTIVWPVEVEPPVGEAVEAPDRVVAFLCVDSQKTRAFEHRTDIAFGGVFAHALYPALRYSRA